MRTPASLCLCIALMAGCADPKSGSSSSSPSGSGGGAVVRATAKPPATARKPVTETLHGVTLTDDYRWLEGDNDNAEEQGQVTPDVAAWTDAQNAYTRQVVDTLPGRAALEATLRPLMEVGAVTAPHVRGGRYFYSKREGSQNQP